jgi:tetratricopeptide (TPR) repeat protein
MAAPYTAEAVRLLLAEAWADYGEGRYGRMVAAGGRAVRAAEEADDAALLVRALYAEATGLKMLGDKATALARFTRILALAEDPATAPQLGGDAAAWVVASAYMFWVDCARYLTGIPWRDLFGVLEAAEWWLAATGRRHWRAGLLLQRALVHHWLGEWDAAVAAGQEAFAVYRPGEPGCTAVGNRIQLAEILCDAGRHEDAQPHLQAVLDDPESDSHSCCAAHSVLARCALAAGDPASARRHAVVAVRLAEPHGENILCEPLQALVAACRAAGDLDAAWQAATRHLEVAGRVGEHVRPYRAVRDVVDVALDRGDLDTARRLLADLDSHAAALDTTAGGTVHTDEAAERHRRLVRQPS